MSEELKQCPFCGGDAILVERTFCGIPDESVFEIVCENCAGKTIPYDNQDYIIDVWNTRPAEEALKAEVERLKAALSDISKISCEGKIGDKVARKTMRRIANSALATATAEKWGEDE